jgi:four helix bundle protein
MDEKEFKKLTRDFARDVMLFAADLPTSRIGMVVTEHLVKSGSSVGANYRAACRAKSKPDMAAKLGIVLEEADEVQYWLELTVETRLRSTEEIKQLHYTANRIVGLCVSSIQTLRRKSPTRNRGTEEPKTEEA